MFEPRSRQRPRCSIRSVPRRDRDAVTAATKPDQSMMPPASGRRLRGDDSALGLALRLLRLRLLRFRFLRHAALLAK